MSESKPFRELWLSRHDWPTLRSDISRQGYTIRELTMLMHGNAPSNYHRALIATEPGNSALGFTWADVAMLRDLAESSDWALESLRPWAADLADRIAALLPPREP